MLGAAVQLCTLPWLGFVPDEVAAAPAAAVARLADRLGVPVAELDRYGTRGQTCTEQRFPRRPCRNDREGQTVAPPSAAQLGVAEVR